MSCSHQGRLSGALPWTRSCFVCGEDNPHGLRLKSRIEEGRIVIEYTAREADVGWKRIVHGGIAMTLLDEAMTWAAIVAAGRACVAAELAARLRKPIRAGDALRVEGEVTAARPRLYLTQACIRNGGGEILVSATGKYLPMPPGEAALCSEDFVAGPETIPFTELFQRKE
jgi:uncharacterized protein (TIGR00369 family)